MDTRNKQMTIVGMYVPVTNNETPDMCTLYQSMMSLWQNREHHKIFIVAGYFTDAGIGLPALKKYCQENQKILFLDIHKHYQGCTVPPDIITIISHIKNIDDPNNLVGPYQEKVILLEKYMYDSLVNMSKIGPKGLYHECIPIHYNSDRERLESIYGDIYYESATN